MMTPLTERLEKARLAAGISVPDLARWLTVPWATVRLWCLGKTTPRAYKVGRIEERLGWLEDAVRKGEWLPIPLSVPDDQRGVYLDKLVKLYERGSGRVGAVSAPRAAE